MTKFVEAIEWNGRLTISLFVVTERDVGPDIGSTILGALATSIRSYHLEDEAHILGALKTYEYDLTFESMPMGLGDALKDLLRYACTSASRVAWLGFEGSFSFAHLLDDEISYQVYGVCSYRDQPVVELDEHRRGSIWWRQQVAAVRSSII